MHIIIAYYVYNIVDVQIVYMIYIFINNSLGSELLKNNSSLNIHNFRRGTLSLSSTPSN